MALTFGIVEMVHPTLHDFVLLVRKMALFEFAAVPQAADWLSPVITAVQPWCMEEFIVILEGDLSFEQKTKDSFIYLGNVFPDFLAKFLCYLRIQNAALQEFLLKPWCVQFSRLGVFITILPGCNT